MQIVWLIVVVLTLGLGFTYIGWRLIGRSGLEPHRRKMLWIGFATWFAAVIASLVLGRDGGPLAGVLSWFAYVSMGLLSFLFTLLLIRDIVWIAGLGIGWIRSLLRRRMAGAVQPAFDASRRAHLLQVTNLGVVGAAAAFTSYGIFEARRTPGIVELDVPIANLPPAFEGFRIVQITDIHAGLTVGRDWIETVVDEVRALRPDMIAFTGDVVDGSVRQLRDVVAPFGELQAPQGKFFVTGNHEYYSGADDWVAEMGRLGYDVLMNEHRLVGRDGASIVVAGVTDFTAGQHVTAHRSDPKSTLEKSPQDLVRIFLAHQPKTVRQTESLHFDLMLSGHTHGGQFFPWNLLTTLDQPYLYGMHRNAGRHVYVSKGTGYWGPPVRLAARSEITVLRLTRGVV